MAWSKRKPYYHLKLSPVSFFSMAVRYLKEFFGKESYMEKPYRQGRGEMHQDIPDYNWKFPTWTRPKLPEIPKFGDFPPLPPLPTFPPLTPPLGAKPPINRPASLWEQPGPPTNPLPPRNAPRPGMGEPKLPAVYIQAACDVEYSGPDCLDAGESAIILAASNSSGSFIWGAEADRPDLVSVKNIGYPKLGTTGDRTRFQVTALTNPDPAETVEICIYMGEFMKVGTRLVPGHSISLGITKPIRKFVVAKCGCVRITIPCDPCLADDYVAPSIAEDQGTIEPGTDPCASSSSTKTITVTGGVSPYTWAVSGTGFCLDYATTEGKSNVLRADSSACGTAKITITDYCGNVAICYVRSTDGQWVLQTSKECWFPGITVSECTLTYPGEPIKCRLTKIEGEKKSVWEVMVGTDCTGSDCATAPAFYQSTCTWGPDCHAAAGLTAKEDCERLSNAGATFGCDEPPSCVVDIFTASCAPSPEWMWCTFVFAYATCSSPYEDHASDAALYYFNVFNYLWKC